MLHFLKTDRLGMTDIRVIRQSVVSGWLGETKHFPETSFKTVMSTVSLQETMIKHCLYMIFTTSPTPEHVMLLIRANMLIILWPCCFSGTGGVFEIRL